MYGGNNWEPREKAVDIIIAVAEPFSSSAFMANPFWFPIFKIFIC